MKYLLFAFFIVITTAAIGQNAIDTNKIRKHTDKSIATVERLSKNYAPHVTNFYAVKFDDNSTHIYNADADTLGQEIMRQFKFKDGCYLYCSNDEWKIFVEQNNLNDYKWNQMANISKEMYDSIHIVYWVKLLAFKDDYFFVLNKSWNSNHFTPSYKLRFCNNEMPVLYDDEVFLRLPSVDTALNCKYALINTRWGTMTSKLLADTILIYPDNYNGDFSLLRYNNQTIVYSYYKNEILEQEVQQYLYDPIYNKIIVVKPNYVAFGQEGKWQRFKTRKINKVQLVAYGDYVFVKIEKSNKGLKYIETHNAKNYNEKQFMERTGGKVVVLE